MSNNMHFLVKKTALNGSILLHGRPIFKCGQLFLDAKTLIPPMLLTEK